MNKKLIALLTISSAIALTGCVNAENKDIDNGSQITAEESVNNSIENKDVEDTSGDVEESETEKEDTNVVIEQDKVEEKDEDNDIENVDESEVNVSKNENEIIFENNYDMVKSILENNKMTVLEKKDESSTESYLEAEDGIGDKVSYKLNLDNGIEINYAVEINNILNVDRYKITGTSLDEILGILVPNLEYANEVEEAILAYVDEGVKNTEIDKGNVLITVNGSYDKVDINIIIK